MKILRLKFSGMRGSGVEEGAAASVRLAASPEMSGVTGEYFEDLRPMRSSELSYDRASRVHLWRMSTEMVGLDGVGAYDSVRPVARAPGLCGRAIPAAIPTWART